MLGGAALRNRVGRVEQVAAVQPARIATEGGDVDVLFVATGALALTVVVSRALDIAACTYRGTPLVWHGPGGLASPHPGTLDNDAFQRRFFGGLLTTCGLDAFGPAGSDADGSWGTHGHIDHIGARNVRTHVDVERKIVTIEGDVVQGRMFGERLLLQRRYEIALDGSSIALHDRVRNLGGSQMSHMLLYHCNAGYPLLDASTRLTLPHRSMRPRDDDARKGVNVWDCGGEPDAAFAEQVFIHEPLADASGWCRARFVNSGVGAALEVAFRPEQLSACFSWRMLGVGTYVMAVEPANCPTIEGRVAARAAGTLPTLASNEERSYDLRFSFS